MKKYEVIFKDLQDQILFGRYQPEEFLPSEGELAAQHGVSRDTIRKSLGELESKGWIVRKQGRRSQILPQQTMVFPLSDLASYQEVAFEKGVVPETQTISIENVIIDEGTSEKTGFPPLSRTWRVTRKRLVEGQAYVLDIDYLSQKEVPRLSEHITNHSLYHHLENELQLKIATAQKEIRIELATVQDKILLDLGSDQQVVCVRSRVFLSDGTQFQYTESRHKLDKFRFVVHAVRKHG